MAWHKIRWSREVVLWREMREQWLSRRHDALASTGAETAPSPEPAVTVKKSVTPNYLVCLEDGKKLKMLKRHLRTTYNMSPDDYRAKWGLASDYPMVAPAYGKQRSELAKAIGLGRRSRKAKPRKRRAKA